MALTPEDMAQIADLIKGTVSTQVAEATTPQPQTNDEVQNQPENQPDYYVHLADGTVVISKDAGSTHMVNDEGKTLQVTGRFPVGG
jgi:hypothetical protein